MRFKPAKGGLALPVGADDTFNMETTVTLISADKDKPENAMFEIQNWLASAIVTAGRMTFKDSLSGGTIRIEPKYAIAYQNRGLVYFHTMSAKVTADLQPREGLGLYSRSDEHQNMDCSEILGGEPFILQLNAYAYPVRAT